MYCMYYMRLGPVATEMKEKMSRGALAFEVYEGRILMKLNDRSYTFESIATGDSHECSDKQVYNPIAIHYNA